MHHKTVVFDKGSHHNLLGCISYIWSRSGPGIWSFDSQFREMR